MKRIHIPAEITYRYRILGPSGRHKGFRVQKFEGPKFVGAVSEHPALQAINAQFISGVLTKEAAREQLDQLVETLYKADGVKIARVAHNKTNDAVLKKFLSETYKNKELEDAEGSHGYFRRAVEAVGELSLLSATADELQSALNDKYPDQRQRRLAVSLNSILKWMGRADAVVAQRKKRHYPIKHAPFEVAERAFERITISEEAAAGVDPALVAGAFRTLCRLALYSGLRIGELMALEPGDRAASFLNVNWQINKKGERVPPKWGKRRRVAVFPWVMPLYDQWMGCKDKIPHEVRLRASRIVRSAFRRAYPTKKEWHLRFHDLRHSYAIACLEMGMPIGRVAKNLGNSEKVCEDHYTGHFHTDVTLEQDAALLAKAQALKIVEVE